MNSKQTEKLWKRKMTQGLFLLEIPDNSIIFQNGIITRKGFPRM